MSRLATVTLLLPARRSVAPRLWVVAVLMVLMVMVLLQPPLQAQGGLDTSLREQLEQDVARYQELRAARQRSLEEIRAALGQTSARLEARIAERDQLSKELSALRTERAALLDEIAALSAQQEQTRATIARLESDLEALKVRISGLLLNLYKQRSGRFARVLAQAESFHELRVKNYYLTLLSEQDVALVNELDATLEELFAAQTVLAEQLAERTAKEEALAATEAELAGKEAELSAVIAELEATREGQLAQRQALLREQEQLEATLVETQRQLDAEIERLRQEEERLRREAEEARRAQDFVAARQRQAEADQARARRENLTAPLPPLSSGFIYPIPDPQLIKRYGENNTSYVTLRAPTPNAAVRSVQAGVVYTVNFVSANDGYLVAVRHSDELITIYTNLQPPRVKPGDRVQQGDILGYLGGGTLVPSDELRFWAQVPNRNGRWAFADPATLLGF